MTATIFAPDGNWYLHRIWYTLNAKPNWTKKQIAQALATRMLNLICADALTAKATHLCVPFDGSDVFRYKVYPLYKSSRSGREGEVSEDGMPAREVYKYLDYVIKHLRRAGICVVQLPEYEGDDVIASLTTLNANVVIGSRDKDMFQVLRPGVVMQYTDPVTKQLVVFTHEDVPDKLGGLTVDQMVDYQCLIGDSIDDIPQAKYKMGPKTAQKILLAHGTIKNFYKNDEKARKWLVLATRIIQTNRKLVTLVKDCYLPKPAELSLKAQPGDWSHAYYALCESMKPRNSIKASRGSLASLNRRRL